MKWYRPTYDRTIWRTGATITLMIRYHKDCGYMVHIWDPHNQWVQHPHTCDTLEAAQATAEALWELRHG